MYIGEAARLSGTTVKSIRHYEAIGLLPAPHRNGQYRLYTPQSIEQLQFIKCAQQLGFRLREMQGMFDGEPDQPFPWNRARQAIVEKKQQLAMEIEALQRLHAGLIDFEAQLDTAQADCPLEATPA